LVKEAVLERRHSHLEGTLLAGRTDRYVGTALILVGFGYDFWLILIGIFVLLGARAEEEAGRHPHALTTASPGQSSMSETESKKTAVTARHARRDLRP
jgi:hypothetical protein